MKDLLKYSLIIALVFSGFSCTDLTEQIKDNYTSKFDPANPGVGTKDNLNKTGPNDGLSGAFARLLNGTANHGSYFTLQGLTSDEMVITQKGGDWFDGGTLISLHKHAFAPTGLAGLNEAWGDIYGGIFQCNDLIAAANQTTGNKAQLRVLRAYFYWRLLDLYGRVKIVTTPGGDAPQATRLAVYNFVESELIAALPDLPSIRQDYGRVNKSGANALLARLYLNAEIYTGTPQLQKAIDAADAVINSGVYNLSANYADVFSPKNLDNVEHIFVATFDETTGTGMNFAQMTLHYPSQLTYRLAQQPWNGYSTIEDFYNSYEATDKRRANNFIVGPQTDVAGNPILDLAFDKADPDGAPINYTPKINELFPNGSRQAGARLGKFSFKLGQNPDMDNDFPVLRYGEVLLNKAEALARKNGYGDATALSLVNQLRTRAGVAPFATMTADVLLAERGRELFQESLRRTDLIRFGKFGNAWWEKPASPAYMTIFPIPLQQLQSTATGANPLTQNPGY